MKFLKLLCLASLILSQVTAQNYLHQVVVLNEGRYDYNQNTQIVPVTIGTINASTFNYTPFDTIQNARFASDVVIGNQFIYASADSFLIQYDKNTLQLINSIIVPGIRKIALWNNQVLVTKGEYLKTFSNYLEVYDASTLSFVYGISSAPGAEYSSEGIVISNNKAYIAVGNGFVWGNEKDIIRKIDLNSQSFVSEVNLGSNATNPENILLLNNKIYTLNNQDYSTASISEYDLISGTISTTDLLTPTGCSASAMASNFIYYQVAGDNAVQRFSTSTLNTFDTLSINKNLYGITYDDINQFIYAGNTDFTSYGKIYKMNLTGSIIDSVNVSLSPGNIALDVRVGSGINNAENIIPVNAYPNPTSDFVMVDLRGISSNDILIQLMDGTGKLILADYKLEKNKLIISTKNLATSTYFLLIENNKQKYKGSFIKY